MKQLTCEMCGSTDLMKQDGVFVCQTCGCKYSVEEAKKMMVEGTVDVTGSTVKVDVSDKVKNLYVMARRAKDDNNAELAAKYYEMITFENPNDWESLFYFNYYTAKHTTLGDMTNSVIHLSNSLDSVFELINKSEQTADKKWSVAQEIIERINTLCESFISWAKRHYKDFSGVKGSVSDLDYRANAIADLQIKMADLLEKYFAENSSKIVASYLKSYVENYLLLDTVGKKVANLTIQYRSKELIAAETRIKKIEPEYKSLVDEINIEKSDINNDLNKTQNNSSSEEAQNKGMIQVNYQMGHDGVNGWRLSPNSAGGVSVRYAIKNVGTKTIKYYSLYFVPYNSVGDIVNCSIRNEAESGVKGNGPIKPNCVKNYCVFQNAWYNHSITSIKLVRAEIEYMDGTKETIQGDQITSIAAIKMTSDVKIPMVIGGILGAIIGIFFLNDAKSFSSLTEVEMALFVGAPALLLALIGFIIGALISDKKEKRKEQKKKDKPVETNDEPNNVKKSDTNESTKKKRKIGIICSSVIAGIIILLVIISSFGNKINSDLVGTWRSEQDSSVSITFKNNGDMIVRSSNAVDDGLSYKIDDDTVIVTFANNDTETYGFVVEENTLIFGENYYTKVQ